MGHARKRRGPTVTSLEECASRKALSVDHTPGSHSSTDARAGSRRPSRSSIENNLRRRYLNKTTTVVYGLWLHKLCISFLKSEHSLPSFYIMCANRHTDVALNLVVTQLRLTYLAKNPLTGSMWLAVRSHLKLWCSWRFVVLHVAWDMVPIKKNLFETS